MKKLTTIFLLLLIAPAIVLGGDILAKTLPADYVVNNDASPNETDLQVTVATTGTYDLRVSVHSTSAVRALKMNFGGTATIDAFLAQYSCSDMYDTTKLFFMRRTVESYLVTPSNLDGLEVFCSINGSVEFSSTGTFILKGGQTVPDASDTTMYKGSTMVLIQTD